jgi:PhzF family phenazine biosynthesis protein
VSARPYRVVDVFGEGPLAGNPVAVVHGADGLDDAAMQAFARWTNLSETTFLLAPTAEGADYRVRIWTPGGELPFAGHPTLGTCHAWREAGGTPRRADAVVQQCDAGLVEVRVDGDALAFLAPPLVRSAIPDDVRERLCAALGVDPRGVVDAQALRNGPDWWTLLLDGAERVLAAEPDATAMRAFASVGLVGPHPPGHPTAFEVRGFVGGRAPYEDPVTGSLNAGIGEWLMASGRAPEAYVASQGARLHRAGRVRLARRPDGRLAVGGATRTVVEGTVAP